LTVGGHHIDGRRLQRCSVFNGDDAQLGLFGENCR
jgi:hypothetical protein